MVGPCYIQNHAVKNRVIKRSRCTLHFMAEEKNEFQGILYIVFLFYIKTINKKVYPCRNLFYESDGYFYTWSCCQQILSNIEFMAVMHSVSHMKSYRE